MLRYTILTVPTPEEIPMNVTFPYPKEKPFQVLEFPNSEANWGLQLNSRPHSGLIVYLFHTPLFSPMST